MSVPIRHTVSTSARIAAIVSIVLALVLLAWIGGEAHYRTCLTKAQVTYPTFAQADPYEAKRGRAINDCSRLPF